jgi:YD repeat-containing protein
VAVVRVTEREYQLRSGQAPYTANDYRVLLIREEHKSLTGTSPTTLAMTVIVRDLPTGLPLEDRRYQTATKYARAVRTFDRQTGNVLTVRRPTQSTALMKYTYDSHKLMIVKTVNELGHAVSESYDLGTGMVVKREGPNWRSYTLPKCTPSQANSCTALLAQSEIFKVDGLGRVYEHSASADPPANTTPNPGYVQKPVMAIEYHDATPAIPRRRVTRRYRDMDTTVQVITEEHLDGLGRVIKRIDRRQIVNQPDAITSFAYDAQGNLARIDAPDPRTDAGSTVPTVYRRDGLGRVVQLLRPAGNSEVVTYDGLRTRVEEFSATRDLGKRTELVRNPFGLLVQVIEHNNPLPGQSGITTYAYDAQDRMTSIVDEDGHLTTMTYDWANNRTSISRGARTWICEYDLGGNMLAEISPLPTGAAAGHYRSEFTYDELDRLKTHKPAPGALADDLSAARRTTLGIGTTTLTYDATAVGQPATVTLPFGRIEYLYDARGESESRSTNNQLPGFLDHSGCGSRVERARRPG